MIFFNGTLKDEGSVIEGQWTLEGITDKFRLRKDYEEKETQTPPPMPTISTPLPVTNYSSNDIWGGFFEQNGEKTEMIFTMFSAKPGNQITGTGTDPVGSFHLFGTCDSNGNALFTKQYDEQHPVAYQGKLNGEKMTGSWTLQGQKGNFEIEKQPKPWTGYYVQNGQQGEMKIENLNIFNGAISGKGTDPVGSFSIVGQIIGDSKINFTKQYAGKDYFVNYTGTYDKENILTGTWSIPNTPEKGDFKLTKAYYDKDPHIAPAIPQITPPPPPPAAPLACWRGTFTQDGATQDMQFDQFSAEVGGPVTGSGSDNIGKFTIQGCVDATGQFVFIKQYVGKYALSYQGQMNGNSLSGVWFLQGNTGSFQLSKQ